MKTKTGIITALMMSAAIGLTQVGPAMAVGSEESQTYYQQAQEYFDTADYRAAMIELRNALKADPNNVDARLLLAQVYLRFGQGIAAQTEIEAARQRGADRSSTAVWLARAYLIQRKFDEAIEELDAVEIPEASRMEAHLIAGDVYFAKGDVANALDSFQQAEAAAPDHHLPKMALARQALQSGDPETAEIKIAEAEAIAPTDSNVYLTKGLVARAQGRREDALAALTTSIDLSEGNLAARLERAAMYVEVGDTEQGQADLDAVYAVVPNHPMALYLSAVIFARERNYDNANSVLEQTGSALDNFLPGVLLKGIVAYNIGNLEQAALLLSRVVNEQPANIAARRAYGATLLRQGNARAAVGALEPLIELGDDDARVYALIGSAYMQIGDIEKAQGYLEESVNRAPDAQSVRTQLALGKFVLGEKETAITDLQDVMADDPNQLRAAIMLALIERREGNLDNALRWANHIVEAVPDSAIGLNMRGAIYISRKEFDKARADFDTALEINPNLHLARSNLAQLERLEGDNDEARRLLQYIVNEDRNNTRALISLTELAIQLGNTEEAVDWASRAVNVAPGVAAYHLLLMQAELKNNDLDAAYQTARTADTAFPDDPTVVAALGRIQFAREEYDDAAASYSRWVRMQPDNTQARLNLGRAEWKAGRIESAKSTYARGMGMAAEGKGEDYRNMLADMITIESESGNFEVALGYALEMQKVYPDTAIPDLMIGSLYYEADRIDEAIRAFRRAVDTEDSVRTRRALARAYLKGGDGDAAVQTLEGWISANPDSMEAVETLGLTLIQLKRWSEAATQIETVLASQEEPSAILLNNLAVVYQNTGNAAAQETAQRAYDLDPGNPHIADTLGWVLVDSDADIRRGLLLLQEAVRGSEGDPSKHYHLGVALAKNGRTAEARQSLRRALDMTRDFDEEADARELLQELSGS